MAIEPARAPDREQEQACYGPEPEAQRSPPHERRDPGEKEDRAEGREGDGGEGQR